MSSSECRDQLTALMEAHNERISNANDFLQEIKNAIATNQQENLQRSLSRPALARGETEQLAQQRYQL